jgi:hypothetical protein
MISAIHRARPVFDQQHHFKGSRQEQKDAVPTEDDATGQSALVEELVRPGSDQNSPAFKARKAVAAHPDLAELKFGKIVSLLARGFGLSSLLPVNAPVNAPVNVMVDPKETGDTATATQPQASPSKESTSLNILA